MTDSTSARPFDSSCMVPLGRTAVFYVPAHKMSDPRYGSDGRTPTDLFDRFFLTHFGGLTHEASHIRGQWTSADGTKVFTDLHQRYEVSFSGREKLEKFLSFLSEMCGRLEEESLYVTIGSRSWLIKPPTEAPSP